MTREEAIERFAKKRDNAISFPDGCEVISLYDSIEIIKEIYNDLQNRTCKNCKYATLDSARYLPVHKCLVGCNGVDYNFYCNKWEQK